jgi:hypothetical protein
MANAIRGSSAIDGALDTSIECKYEDIAITLKCAKQKEDRAFPDIRLWRAEVADSCVIQSRALLALQHTTAPSEEALRKALWDCCGTDGLTSNELLEITGLPKTTFYRVRKVLIEQGEMLNVGTELRPRFVPNNGSRVP